jgi:hypothetical protein
MADTKISALTAVGTVATTDEFAVNQGGASKKVTLAQILAGTAAAGPVPVGGIILWSGTIATIPTTWKLCNGTDNTGGPDLRDKFIVGATQDDSGAAKTNLTGSLTQSGSAAVSSHSLSTNVAVSTHSLSTNVAIDTHALSTNVAVAAHTLNTGTGRTSTASTVAYVTTSGSVTHTITQPVVSAHALTQPVVSAHTVTQPVVSAHTSNWPTYFALAYIQRIA